MDNYGVVCECSDRYNLSVVKKLGVVSLLGGFQGGIFWRIYSELCSEAM